MEFYQNEPDNTEIERLAKECYVQVVNFTFLNHLATHFNHNSTGL